MAWKYNISEKCGDALQRMIQNSDRSHGALANILEQSRLCCNEVVKLMDEADDPGSCDFSDLAGVIDGEPELCRAKDVTTIKEWGYSSFVKLVDDRLSDFYDYCDIHRVWVGIGVPRIETADQVQTQMGGMTQ